MSKIKLLVMVIIAGLFSNVLFAGDVKIYSKPVPAKELGAHLFPERKVTQQRSISFPSRQPNESEEDQTGETSNHLGLLINFAYNSAEILPESEAYIDEIGKMLNLDQYAQQKLVIEGHTDAAGSERYNYYLSEQRAESVKRFLVTHYQIASNRLLTKGLGESKLLSDKSPYDGTNRRVEFYKAP